MVQARLAGTSPPHFGPSSGRWSWRTRCAGSRPPSSHLDLAPECGHRGLDHGQGIGGLGFGPPALQVVAAHLDGLALAPEAVAGVECLLGLARGVGLAGGGRELVDLPIEARELAVELSHLGVERSDGASHHLLAGNSRGGTER
jgi:hypothetical protein